MKEVLKPYVPVCQAIATLLQPHAEVVLHDLATGNIAFIANAFSKRRPGDSSMTDVEVAISIDSSVIGPYRKTNWDRRQLRSVTAVLRDHANRPVGLLCINRSLAMGPTYGLFSGLGVATADALAAGIAALGITLISGLLSQYQVVLRFIGGAFLCYLGYTIYIT